LHTDERTKTLLISCSLIPIRSMQTTGHLTEHLPQIQAKI